MGLIFPKSVPGLPVESIGYREESGARGVWQLGVLVLFSGIVGYLIMRQTGVRAGADFVILTICVGTVVALVCAVTDRVFGASRFCSRQHSPRSWSVSIFGGSRRTPPTSRRDSSSSCWPPR